MSLARAFTTRRKGQEQANGLPSYLGRAASQRTPDSRPIKRSEISLPVALISTTNMLSYEAPDIAGTKPIAHRNFSSNTTISESSTSSSDNESEGSGRSGRSVRSNTLTDISSVDENDMPQTPEPNHLSCYFKSPSPVVSIVSSPTPMDSPTIPQRAPSHSKTAHQLSHKRSLQRIASYGTQSTDKSRDSLDMFSANTPAPTPAPVENLAHPFGKELEQLIEVQEEFSGVVKDAEAEADRNVMQTRGLGCFCAAEYMREISSFYRTFTEEPPAMVGWI